MRSWHQIVEVFRVWRRRREQPKIRTGSAYVETLGLLDLWRGREASTLGLAAIAFLFDEKVHLDITSYATIR
ncbi:hypothetical protein KCU77_g56, partial [Aureobasidium melanogenum]